MASVQRIFGEGPIEGSNHIKLQTSPEIRKSNNA
jgi:hypothetical protein